MKGHMDSVDGEQRSSRRKAADQRKKKVVIAATVILVIMVSFGLALSANWDKWFGKEAVLPPIDPQAVKWAGELPYSPGQQGNDEIYIPGYKSMTVKANSKNVTVSFVNPSSNDCYFVFHLLLVKGEQKEVLYESGLVEPGKGFYDIEISRELKPGIYQAQLQYDAYDMTTKSSLNGAVLDFELYAK